MYRSVLTSYLGRYVCFCAILIGLGVIALLVTRKEKKWIRLLCALCLIGSLVVSAGRIVPVVIDRKQEDYVELNDADVVCKSRTTSFSDLGNASLAVKIEDGRELKLLFAVYESIDAGRYRGTVVYAKRSKIVVYYDLDLADSE